MSQNNTENEGASVIALILAAGASSRMGSPKGLLPWGKSTVLQTIIGQVREAGLENIVLVSGAHHENLLPVAHGEAIRICHHPEWEQGMGSSLARGIECVEGLFPEANAILVLLSDQPFVTSKYLREMLRAHAASPSGMTASHYGDASGVPALFPKAFWEDLKALPPQQGARAFLLKHPDHCQALETGFPLIDIDTPDSYQKALARAGFPTNPKPLK